MDERMKLVNDFPWLSHYFEFPWVFWHCWLEWQEGASGLSKPVPLIFSFTTHGRAGQMSCPGSSGKWLWRWCVYINYYDFTQLYGVCKVIMFLGSPSAALVRLFVRTYFVTTISHEWLEQSWWNVREIFNSRYWWLDYILEVKGQGHSRLPRWQRHPRRRWGVAVHLLVWSVLTSLCPHIHYEFVLCRYIIIVSMTPAIRVIVTPLDPTVDRATSQWDNVTVAVASSAGDVIRVPAGLPRWHCVAARSSMMHVLGHFTAASGGSVHRSVLWPSRTVLAVLTV